MAHPSHLEGIKAADLKTCLHSYVEYMWEDPSQGRAELAVTEIAETYFSDEAPPGDVAFILENDEFLVELSFFSDEWLDPDDYPEMVSSLIQALQPTLSRKHWQFIKWETDGHYVAPFLFRIKVKPNLRGQTLADLYQSGRDLLTLLDAMQGGELTRETTLQLLRAGKADVLVGQPEGPWLDVKSDHYDLKTRGGNISLAQAVARFANAEHGGIVVVGMRGKKVPGGEEIRGICPLPLDKGIARKYQHALENYLYPPPDFLEIEEVVIGGGMIILLHVPPQPEELKPFLVHGAIVDDGVEGAFISIVRRRGESSIPITAAAIHSTLSAGRALMRRGVVVEPASNADES